MRTQYKRFTFKGSYREKMNCCCFLFLSSVGIIFISACSFFTQAIWLFGACSWNTGYCWVIYSTPFNNSFVRIFTFFSPFFYALFLSVLLPFCFFLFGNIIIELFKMSFQRKYTYFLKTRNCFQAYLTPLSLYCIKWQSVKCTNHFLQYWMYKALSSKSTWKYEIEYLFNGKQLIRLKLNL